MPLLFLISVVRLLHQICQGFFFLLSQAYLQAFITHATQTQGGRWDSGCEKDDISIGEGHKFEELNTIHRSKCWDLGGTKCHR